MQLGNDNVSGKASDDRTVQHHLGNAFALVEDRPPLQDWVGDIATLQRPKRS
jgi:hypothetical protein